MVTTIRRNNHKTIATAFLVVLTFRLYRQKRYRAFVHIQHDTHGSVRLHHLSVWKVFVAVSHGHSVIPDAQASPTRRTATRLVLLVRASVSDSDKHMRVSAVAVIATATTTNSKMSYIT